MAAVNLPQGCQSVTDGERTGGSAGVEGAIFLCACGAYLVVELSPAVQISIGLS